MIHVRGHPLPGGDGTDIDDRLGGDPGRYKTDVPGPEFLQSQEFQTEHLLIEVYGALHILGIDYHMVESHHVHGSLPRVLPCEYGFSSSTTRPQSLPRTLQPY